MREEDEEDTLFIMQDPDWMTAVGETDRRLFTVQSVHPGHTTGDLGDGTPINILVRRQTGDYGSVDLHAAEELYNMA